MTKFCPECGHRLESLQAKFCSECGTKLTVEEVDESEKRPITSDGKNVYDLGIRLEKVVERIFQDEGYITKRRERIEGKSGALNEIDIVAERGKQKIAIECKNYSSPVGIEKVRDFASKLRDLGPSWAGIIVSYSDFTSEAETYAESEDIDLMGREELTEKWLAIEIGRGNRRGEKIELEYALPLNYDFNKATQLDLQNKEFVSIKEAKLIYHPYYKIKYQVKWKKRDPSKELHEFNDQGTVYIDALDNVVLNELSISGSINLAMVVGKIVSQEGRSESSYAKKTMQELAKGTPHAYSLMIGEDYSVKILPSRVNPKQALKTCLQYIIKKHTHTIKYVRKDDTLGIIRYAPKESDVTILNKEVVHIPKWRIQFVSKDRVYSREIFGYSGVKIKDAISMCPRHAIDILGFKKRAVAVCEVCGLSLCENHVKQCSICNKWTCVEHSKQCSVCKSYFCEEHPMSYCEICDGLVCFNCIKKCELCAKQYCAKHTVVCENCGIEVCPNCSTSRGIIRKTKLCIKCNEKNEK